MSRPFPQATSRGLSFLAAGLVLALSGEARADCARPGAAPYMPQGATATADEMREGRDALQAHVNVLQAYQACLETQIKNAPADAKPETKQGWQAEADAAVEVAHRLAEVYGAQLRAFKARP